MPFNKRNFLESFPMSKDAQLHYRVQLPVSIALKTNGISEVIPNTICCYIKMSTFNHNACNQFLISHYLKLTLLFSK